MELHFGVCCPPLSKQLGDLVSKDVGSSLDKSAEAIDRLRIHSLLSASEVHKARLRLIKVIGREIKMASAKKRKKQ